MGKLEFTKAAANSLRANWILPLSALAFFCLNATPTKAYLLGVPIAAVVAMIVAMRIGPIREILATRSRGLLVLSAATALGICLSCQASFCSTWASSPEMQALGSIVLIPMGTTLGTMSVIGAALAFPAVYTCVLAFWLYLTGALRTTGAFRGIGRGERVFYGVLLAALVAFMAVTFTQTGAFYHAGTRWGVDVVYTSDSTRLIEGNVYLTLAHQENDLRQPLFAVFAAPFCGIPYLISWLAGAASSLLSGVMADAGTAAGVAGAGASAATIGVAAGPATTEGLSLLGSFVESVPVLHAIVLNAAQIAMLLVANFLLARTMGLTARRRICFMLIASLTYMQLLFTLMMEQYIVAYFWLVLCVHLVATGRQLGDRPMTKRPTAKGQPTLEIETGREEDVDGACGSTNAGVSTAAARIALWGAGGTLLTSLALMPFVSAHSPFPRRESADEGAGEGACEGAEDTCESAGESAGQGACASDPKRSPEEPTDLAPTRSSLKAWILDMIRNTAGFAILMLAFCRLDVLIGVQEKATYLNKFASRDLTIGDKLCQYTEFIRSCFTAPAASLDGTTFTHTSWQLDPVTSISWAGAVVLALVVASAIWNRRKKTSQIAIAWVGFSAVMLVGFGWGAAENGLILYSLYFGWAFLVLLFQLAERVEDALTAPRGSEMSVPKHGAPHDGEASVMHSVSDHVGNRAGDHVNNHAGDGVGDRGILIPALAICCVIALAAFNIPAIAELLSFAISCYPV